jgi:hypothetical protein
MGFAEVAQAAARSGGENDGFSGACFGQGWTCF